MTTAKSFVAARREARALADFPGTPPASMAEAYAVQDEAIRLWGERPVGWKVGLVPPHYRDSMDAERLVGPVFAVAVAEARGVMPMPAFEGGFGAVEAEFVIEVGADADPDRHAYTAEEAAALVGRVRMGVEPAGSPFSGINDHGPAVTAADFGNNAGLILGPEIADWPTRAEILRCATFVDSEEVGTGDWRSVPGTPLAAFAFAIGHLAARGYPLRRGDLVTTGAVTGIHRVAPGQRARVVFDGVGEIELEIVAARPG